MEEGGGGNVFDGVVFTIIPNEDLGHAKAGSYTEIIEDGGGRFLPLHHPENEIQGLDQLTHIISTHIDFPQYNEALENGIHVVKPSWVRSSIEKNKAAQPRQHSPDPSQYFQDVVLTCADIPEGDQDAIIAGVLVLGGQYSSPLSKMVTHMVTNDMGHEKCRIAKEKGLKTKIVLPNWFDDCFRLGRKISERPYLFPDPEILRKNNGKIGPASSDHLEGASEATPSGQPPSSFPCSPTATRKQLNALAYKKVKLGKDLSLMPHLKETLETLIDYAGAKVVTDVDEANIYIGQYRDGDDYVTACRAGKEVANLSWLYYVLNRNKYTSPTARLLHYPVPRKGIEGMQGMKISLSNYTGDARVYLENLITHCGATYTKTMKQDNTHLITAHTTSEKCEAAMEWNIHIVNHMWLEESYAKCAVQTLSNPRYNHWPARTNLGEVTGQTRLDMKAVERQFFAKPRDSPKKVAQPTVTTSKPKKPASAANNTLATSTAKHNDTPAHLLLGDDDDVNEPSTAKKKAGRPSKSQTATPRFRDDEKENESPILEGSARASKAKALDKLHEAATDISLFQKEMKRKGGVTHGRSSFVDEMSSPVPAPKPRKKRTSDELTYDATAVGSELSDGETQDSNTKPTKKARTAAPTELPPVRYRMMVTGDKRWMNSRRQEDMDRRTLRQLGVLLTVDPKDVQILVAPQIKRTRKFVSALACAPLVVDTSYLDSALNKDELVEDPSLLEDPESEEKFGFVLSEALERAKINDHHLFRGWTIYITRDIPGGFDTYKEIVTLNGGTPTLYQGRIGLTLRPRKRDDAEAGPEVQHQGGEDELDCVYLVSGESDTEKHVWEKFRTSAKEQGLVPRIVKHDWLLNTAMRQEVAWDAKKYSLA